MKEQIATIKEKLQLLNSKFSTLQKISIAFVLLLSVAVIVVADIWFSFTFAVVLDVMVGALFTDWSKVVVVVVVVSRVDVVVPKVVVVVSSRVVVVVSEKLPLNKNNRRKNEKNRGKGCNPFLLFSNRDSSGNPYEI